MATQQPATQLTTEQIQQMLEENYSFIKAIVDQQNLGRLEQMAQYQEKLQQNLMRLAAVADSQPSGGNAAGAGPGQQQQQQAGMPRVASQQALGQF